MKLFKLTIYTSILLLLLPSITNAEKIIVIDPGHGGIYSGTCGYSGRQTGYCEKEANLSVALKLKEILDRMGFKVYLTRSTDTEFSKFIKKEDGSYKEGDFGLRMSLANGFAKGNTDNSIFISIHHNANATNPFRRGIETYYYDGVNHAKPEWTHDPMQILYLEESKRLAETVHPILVDKLKLPNRKIHSDQSFYVIRNAQMPAVLVELGYLINRNEEKLIKTPQFQNNAAQALADAVERYFQVYEVFDVNDKKLATFTSLRDAITFTKLDISSERIYDKNQQVNVYRVWNNSRVSIGGVRE